jgi:hypothetical protein
MTLDLPKLGLACSCLANLFRIQRLVASDPGEHPNRPLAPSEERRVISEYAKTRGIARALQDAPHNDET